MKQLIEDYIRRLKTAKEMKDDLIQVPNAMIVDHEKYERLTIKIGCYNTIIAELQREYKSKLSAYTDVWVIQTFAGCEVDNVFINKEDAEKEAEKNRTEYLAHYRKVNKRMNDEEWEKFAEKEYKNKFKVVSLDDAIYEIKDEVRNEHIYSE